MSYANTSQLSEYLGVSEEEIPSDSLRLLERASELVDYFTLGRINDEIEKHVEVASKAVCAQVEYMMVMGEDFGIMGTPEEIQAGKFKMKASYSVLAPRAKIILAKEGFLYRGGVIGI